MRRAPTAFAPAVLAMLLILDPAVSLGQASMPMRLGVVRAEKPTETSYWHWLSVRSFQDQSGNWHIEQLPPLTQRMIDHFVAATHCDVEHECIQVRQPRIDLVPGRPGGPWSYGDLVAAAQSVVAGRVAAADFGFIDGLPAQLLGVEVTHLIRTTSGSEPTIVYVAYPQATFQLGRYAFCPYPDDQLAAAPTVGSEVLLVSLEGPMEDTADLFQLLETGADLYWQAPGESGLVAVGKITLQSGELSGISSVAQLVTRTEGMVSGGDH